MLKLRIAPPLNRSNIPRRALDWNSRSKAAGSMPGTGTCAIKRNTTSIANVNNSFCRRSGSRSALDTACSIAYLLDLAASRFNFGSGGRGEAMGSDREGSIQRAIAQDLHRQVRRPDQSSTVQHLGRDLCSAGNRCSAPTLITAYSTLEWL